MATSPPEHLASSLEVIRPANDDENQGLQRAIRESLDARYSPTTVQFGDPVEPPVSAQSPARRVNIEDRIKEMSLLPALELPFVCDPTGDTWVYIDPPPKQPEQDELDYARYTKRYEFPMLVKKAALLEHCTPDPEVEFNFQTLFGPSAQFRTIRRRKLSDKVRDSPNVKYVIDLTPPTEGDDAVYLTTELCCSKSVRLWYQASDIWNVSSILVGGSEEYTSVRQPDLASSKKASKEHNGASSATDGTPLSQKEAGSPMPLEYSPVRHRSAIERVIAALVGTDPKLDSAPKVWTTFAVAKYLGIINSPVTDYIVRWLRAYPNSFFLEVCPEISLRIADGLESHDLARDTFAILVGEEALDSLVRARLLDSNHRRSVYGRRKEDLPEKIYSRIEYASKRFLERINTDFRDFAGKEMLWVDELPEVRKLSFNAQPQLQDIIKALKGLLKDYVRGTIYKLLCVNYTYVPTPDFHRRGGDELIERSSRSHVWINLNASERILSRTFWHALLSTSIFRGPSNLDIQSDWNETWDGAKSTPEEKRELDLGTYRQVWNTDLNSLIRRGDSLRMVTKDEKQQPVKLPNRTRLQAYTAPNLQDFPPAKLRQPDSDPVCAHPATLLFAEDSIPALQPSGPINVRPASSDIAPQDFKFDFDSSLSSTNQSISRVDNPTWPFGAPRECDWVRAPSNEEGHVITAKNGLATSDDGLETAVAVSETVKNQRDWPAPPGYKSWSSWNLESGIAKAWKVEREVRFQERHQTENSTPPSIFKRREMEEEWMKRESKKQKTGSEPATTEFFNLYEFFLQAIAYIEATGRRKLQYADCLIREEPHEIGMVNTLVCLQDSEWKYLPLWAGGYDDGTGGVFNDQLPASDLGFSTPGPEVHTGVTPANSIRTPSEYGMVDSDDGVDTVNTSMVNNRSFAGALDRKRVYAADSMDSTSNDDFDMVTAEGDCEEDRASRLTDAQERVEAAEAETASEARLMGDGTARVVDETYADLFNDDEDDQTERADDDDDCMMSASDEDNDTVMV